MRRSACEKHIERTICTHSMLKRVQKEVRELKKKFAKKHKKLGNIFTLNVLHCSEFKALSSVVFLVDSVCLLRYR